MTVPVKGLLGASLLLAAASVFLSALLFTMVNQSRVNVAFDSCQAQNARHDRTIYTLDARLATVKPAQRARAQASREFTVALIDALAPKQDCKALVKRRFGSDAHPN